MCFFVFFLLCWGLRLFLRPYLHLVLLLQRQVYQPFFRLIFGKVTVLRRFSIHFSSSSCSALHRSLVTQLIERQEEKKKKR